MCSIFCYYSNQLPSLIVDPATALKSVPNPSTSSRTPPTKSEELQNRWHELLKKYTFSSLEGKYLYFATGKQAIHRHLASMRKLGSIEQDWLAQQFKEEDEILQQQEAKEKPKQVQKPMPDKTYRGLMVLAYHRDYESVINIAHSIATGFATIHAHFEKIYGPSYRIISKLPSSFAQLRDSDETKIPSQFTLIHGLVNRPLLSDSITLMNRSFESLSEVLSRLVNKYASSLDKDDPSSNRFGGKSNRPSSPPPQPPV